MKNPARILVVDDNETNRDILMTRLEKHGYELLQAADGEEALSSVRQHRPDLLLLDVEMPKLNGFEVCRRLKNDCRCRSFRSFWYRARDVTRRRYRARRGRR